MNTKSKKKKLIFISWALVFIWYGVILSFSSIPQLRISPDVKTDEILRIPAHLIEYLVLTIFIWHALWQSRCKKLYFKAWLSVLVLSLFDEWWQSHIPTRTWQLQDLMWDNIGSLLILFLLKAIYQVTSTKSPINSK